MIHVASTDHAKIYFRLLHTHHESLDTLIKLAMYGITFDGCKTSVVKLPVGEQSRRQ
jgi:hypothetical protein